MSSLRITLENKSAPSNWHPRPHRLARSQQSEVVIDGAYMERWERAWLTYGTRTALIYVKTNPTNSTWDTWLYVNDSGTGQNIPLPASPVTRILSS